MGIGRSISRAVRRVSRSVSRAVRRVGREVETAVRNPLVQGAVVGLATGGLGLGVLGTAGAIGAGLGTSAVSSQMQSAKAQEKASKAEQEAISRQEQAEQEAKKRQEVEEAKAREEVLNSYDDTTSALGSLGVSGDQTLGSSKSALGKKKKVV